MDSNTDYIKGIKYIMKVCYDKGIKYKKYPWVADLSKLLSESGSCYNFWYEVDRQNMICRIPYCTTVYDILYGPNLYLMTWADTAQGFEYWSNVFRQLFFSKFNDMQAARIAKRIQLSDILHSE